MRCRRGHLLTVGAIILALVVIELIRGATYNSNDRPPTHAYNKNASEFLASKNHLDLNPNKVLMSCDTNVEVLLVVPSAVYHQEARAAVRNSWSPRLPSFWQIVFFLGATDNSLHQDQIKEEANKFEDIIQDSRFLDSYYNLTLKSLALLQWTHTYCTNAKFLLKIDDDMYLNIPKLHQLITCISEARGNIYNDKSVSKKLLNGNKGSSKYNGSDECSNIKPYDLIHYYINAETHEYESYFYGGYLYEGVKADHNVNSKWYLDSKLYPKLYLPPFLSGTASIMSINLIQHLLNAAKNEPIIHLEDVYITGLLASNGLKLKLSHLEGWSRFRPRWDSACLFQELLTVHGLSPSELLTMTSSVDGLDHGECDTYSVHFSNFLNLLISSAFPRIT